MTRTLYVFLILTLLTQSGCNTAQTAHAQQQPSVSIEKNTWEVKTRAQRDLASGNYESAAKSYYTILQRNSDDHEARFGLAESYFKLGNGEQALAHFRKLLTVSKYKVDAQQGLGLSHLQKGEPEYALDFLADAVSNNESLWRSWNGLAQIYDSQKEWQKSADAYEMALKHTDRPEVIYNNMGVSYMAQEDFEKAAQSFGGALKHKSDLDVAKTNYRLALAMQDRYDEATLDHDVHEEAKAFNNAGYTAMRRGNYAEAEKLFLKAVEANPSFYKPAYDNLQVLYYLKNKKK